MIRELKTLVAVARTGTFAAAGDSIGLTQAAVSAQMQRLEADLGFELFDRAGRTARLNKAGQQTLMQAQELLRLYGNLGNAPGKPGESTLVTVGSIASIQRSMLPNALAKFYRQYPGCRTRIMPGLSVDLVNLVDAGEIDMAAVIRPPFTLHRDLAWTLLSREPFRLLVPRGLPDNDWAAILGSHPFIRYDRSSYGGRQVDRFLRAMHLVPLEVCEVDELEAMVKLVANGVGVALVPETSAIRWPAAVHALDLKHQTFHREVGLVHRSMRSLSEPVAGLLKLIAAQAGTKKMDE